MKTLALLLAFASLPAIPKPDAPRTDRERVLAVAASQIGVAEKTGKNDGEVDKYLAAVGLGGTRNPYCAAYNYWVGKEALGSRNPYPRSAWSPDHLKGGNRVTATSPILGGEAFGIYFPAKGRIAHTGLVSRRDGANIITIEANTSGAAASGTAADRDGQGVFSKRRHWRTVHSTKDWISN
jgi:hypothetical protein